MVLECVRPGYRCVQLRSPKGGTRIELFSADQSDPAELARIAAHFGTARGGGARAGTGGFDAIVDDGSHTPRDQVSTLAMLFPLVRPGGAFIIEDIGSSWNHDYGHLTPARGAPRQKLRGGRSCRRPSQDGTGGKMGQRERQP